MTKLAVIAIGGNSLIKDRHHQRVEDQYNAIKETAGHIAGVIAAGYRVVLTHGNGPQVGFILRRSEIAYAHEGLHFVPLVSCVADTQGAIGYQLQQALNNEFRRLGLKNKKAVSLVTQVRIAPQDPALAKASKPIGAFYGEQQVDKLSRDHPDWVLVEDAGRGYRRAVPSPAPVHIEELDAVAHLLEAGFTVVAAGGGGIPVVADDSGMLNGLDAVIDKDLTASLLATALGADDLVISTAVSQVYLHFKTPRQKALDHLTVDEARRYIEQDQFAPGSMLPKIQAALAFAEQGGRAIITAPEKIGSALAGRAGTHIRASE